MKTVRYRLEALAVAGLFRLFGALPRRRASALGGAFGRLVGRALPRVSRTADRNLRRVLPELPAAARRRITIGVWDNIGRVAAEMPHVHRCMPGTDIVVKGAEHLTGLAAGGQPVIFVSGHLANWEIFALVAAWHTRPVTRVYRAANNPAVEAHIQKSRAQVPGGCIPKGAKGARAIIRALQSGQNLGFLIDQRMSDGETVPFFGLPSRTATAPVDLAIRFGCPIVPAQCVRLPDSRFEVIVHPPIMATVERREAVLVALNKMLETWIRAHPDQWLWVHNRWK